VEYRASIRANAFDLVYFVLSGLPKDRVSGASTANEPVLSAIDTSITVGSLAKERISNADAKEMHADARRWRQAE
jgi:hypothetical protein